MHDTNKFKALIEHIEKAILHAAEETGDVEMITITITTAVTALLP
jgi:hypothetical protein